MSWNNDNVPEIDISYDDSQMKSVMASISATLDKNNFGTAGAELQNMAAMASYNGERAVNKLAEQTTDEVRNLMEERQYRQPSYHPGVKAFDRKANNQRMVDNLKDHVENNKHRIYTTTTNGGYNYSQAFEFGLLTRNYPAHHPFQDAATHLGLNQMNGSFDDEINEAIRRGFS